MIIDYYQGDEIYYPSSDNEPMGENDVICWLMTASLDMLKRHFQNQPQVYVSSNSFVYYVKGDVEQRVAPDLYVVKGVEAKQRPNYKVWEEGVVPQVVFEFTTESSRYKDLGTKKGLYEALGVKEYYLFDPAAEYLTPHFRAFRMVDEVLVERPTSSSFFSKELQLTIRPEGQLLRFYAPDCLQPVPTSQELEEIAAVAREQAARAAEHALQAEEEASQAKEEASQAKEEASQAKEEASQAKEEASQAKDEASQAKEEAKRERERAEQLQRELDALRGQR